MSRNSLSKKDFKFDSSKFKNNKNQDITTLKSLNDVVTSSPKNNKSTNNLKNFNTVNLNQKITNPNNI